MASGIIKSKTTAEDGIETHNNGTVQDSSDSRIYSFKNESTSLLQLNSGVTFNISERDSDGNIWATDIEPIE